MIDRHATLVGYGGALGVVVVVLEIVALTSGGRVPGLGRVVRRLTGPRWGQWLVVVAWMWLGWHAFAR